MKTLLAASRTGLLLCPLIALAGCTVSLVEPGPAAYQPTPAIPLASGGYAQPAYVNAAEATEPPPPLPEYSQPPCPGEGWIWTPGYWAYGLSAYYWVPGSWIMPPRPGLLWTPGYWAFVAGVYTFRPGYWARHVGFYGGIDYGYGYTGVGYAGGRWDRDRFIYNRAVTNVNVSVVHDTYYRRIPHRVGRIRVSYNGGRHGIFAAPTVGERRAARDPHLLPTDRQRQHMREAAQNAARYARRAGPRPDIVARPPPAAFGLAGARSEDHRGRGTVLPRRTGALPTAALPVAPDSRRFRRRLDSHYGRQRRLTTHDAVRERGAQHPGGARYHRGPVRQLYRAPPPEHRQGQRTDRQRAAPHALRPRAPRPRITRPVRFGSKAAHSRHSRLKARAERGRNHERR